MYCIFELYFCIIDNSLEKKRIFKNVRNSKLCEISIRKSKAVCNLIIKKINCIEKKSILIFYTIEKNKLTMSLMFPADKKKLAIYF